MFGKLFIICILLIMAGVFFISYNVTIRSAADECEILETEFHKEVRLAESGDCYVKVGDREIFSGKYLEVVKAFKEVE